MRIALAAASIAIVLMGCGSSSDGNVPGETPETDGGADAKSAASGDDAPSSGDDAGIDSEAIDAAFVTAPHSPMPQLAKHTGAMLKSPHLVSISYAGYKYQGQVDDLGAFMVTSNWLTSVGKEYGISAGTHEAVHLTGPAPASLTDAQVRQLIFDGVAAKTMPPTTATDIPIYMLYLPGTTSETDGTGASACGNGFIGYHDAATQTGVDYVYAIVADSGTGLADVTSTAAHELIEALTDPYNSPKDGYYLDVANSDLWVAADGNEVADMCDFEPLTTEGSWSLERSYSNAAAKAGTSPCVPVPAGDVYFNVSATPATIQNVAAGKSFTFTLTGWSTAPMASWPIDVFPADTSDFDPAPVLSAKSINNGETVTVTVTAPASATSGQLGGAFILSGNAAHIWPVAIQIP